MMCIIFIFLFLFCEGIWNLEPLVLLLSCEKHAVPAPTQNTGTEMAILSTHRSPLLSPQTTVKSNWYKEALQKCSFKEMEVEWKNKPSKLPDKGKPYTWHPSSENSWTNQIGLLRWHVAVSFVRRGY